MNQQRLIAGIAIALVAGLVITGLFVSGSPSTARKEQADSIRVEHLVSLHFQLQDHAVRTGVLPESLSELAFGESNPRFDPRKDPETGEFFEYEKMGELSYEICATFQTDSTTSARHKAPVFDAFDDFYSHGSGRKCYRLGVTRSEGVDRPRTVIP